MKIAVVIVCNRRSQLQHIDSAAIIILISLYAYYIYSKQSLVLLEVVEYTLKFIHIDVLKPYLQLQVHISASCLWVYLHYQIIYMRI